MNITMRKLVLLEEQLAKKEKEAEISGYLSTPIDQEFREKITKLIDKIRR